MKSTLMAVAFVLSTACIAQAQDIAGDWQGTLKVGDAELRLALHVTKSADGGLKATMDSIDQAANGIPVTAITLEGSKVKFTVDAVHGTYDGTVNAAATAIDGTWSQGQPLPLAFARAVPKPAATGPDAKPSDIDGAWLGTLDTGGAALRLAFHITNTGSGLTATLDSLDQGAKGLPVTIVTRNGPSLKMELKQLGGTFEGTIDGPLTNIEGTWTQGGRSLPLVLKRVIEGAMLERPRQAPPV